MKYSFNNVKGLFLLTFLTFALQQGFSQCVSNCEIQCQGNINVSLGQNCEAMITPAMGGIGITQACNTYYEIKVWDAFGNAVVTGPSTGSGTGSGSFPIVTFDHVGQTLTYEIIEPECGNKCWGTLDVEYKLAPQIACPDDVTVQCSALPYLSFPPASGGCVDFEVDLLNEVKTTRDCDPDFTADVVRTYITTDVLGNTATCSHTVTLERFDFTSVVYPPNASISCSDTTMRFGPNGAPLPWYSIMTSPITGSGSYDFMGIPFICHPDDGLTSLNCPATGSGSGIPLIPPGGAIVLKQIGGTEHDPIFTACEIEDEVINQSQTQLCSALLTYTDVIFDQLPCKTKFIRTWELREWWCSDEITGGTIQLIEIIDDKAPQIVCPANFTITTGTACSGSVSLPPIEAYDECGTELSYLIQSGNSAISTNGGPVNLNLGNNVVTYSVSDGCHNKSSCDVIVTVEDNTEPVAICETYKVVSLSASGNTIVFAEPFDNGSWDECGMDRFEVRRMDNFCDPQDSIFGKQVTFCCTDAGYTRMVVFRAIDKAGNFNDCMVEVEIQDKAIPALTCPDDITTDCRTTYDMANLSLSFGSPTLGDNCNTQNIHEIIDGDINQCGIGSMIRKFQIHDGQGNVVRSCSQNVTITNDDPFLVSNIQWPLDYETNSTCSLDNLGPDNLPDLYNYPTFIGGDDNCTLLGYDYDDKVFASDPISGSCAYIERTWTVINWCESVSGTLTQFVIPVPQRIEIINTISPLIDDQGPVVLENINVDCSSGPFEVKRTATDDCESLNWTFQITNGLGDIVHAGQSNIISHILPSGNYSILWTVDDGCGNSDTDTQDLTIRNLKAPTPVCINGLSANLVLMDTDNDGVLDNEMVELWASDFNAGSTHSCNNEIALSFSSDTTDKFVIFDCFDIGLQEIQLWVTDVVTGQQDYCVTFIDVQDNNGQNICDPTLLERVIVYGQVYTEDEINIENVEVELANNAPKDSTDVDGEYAFGNMPMGGNYDVRPEKDDDYLNGVSTFDLVLIQKHILGTETLDSPYKRIAADANNSHNITALDLIELRKLILGIYEELPSNYSWRFVSADHAFADPFDPWLTEWPESYEIYDLNTDMVIDFVGVKVGDVNGNASVNLKGNNVETRSSKALTFQLQDVKLKKGTTQKIAIYASDYNTIDGWQTTLRFNPDELDIVNFISGQIDIDATKHSNMINADKGWITFSYVHQNTSSIENGDILFEIEVESKENVSSNSLYFDDSKLNSEAYNATGEIMNLKLGDKPKDYAASIIDVRPNPWIYEAKIKFSLPEAKDVNFDFYDMNGRLLYSTSAAYPRGINTLDISKSQINTSGVVYIKMTTDNKILEYKMLIL